MIDITEKECLNKIVEFLKKIDKNKFKYLQFLLVENKIDLEKKRLISNEQIELLMNEQKELIKKRIQISAKSGQGVEKVKEEINILMKNKDNNFATNLIIQTYGEKSEEIKSKYRLNIALLGNSQVGKTTFFNMLNNNKFQENTVGTIGNDKHITNYKYKNEEIQVIFWDTAGQERYRALGKTIYQNADGIFLFFDITDKNTFNDVSLWIQQIKDNNQNLDKLTVFLIGNKIDILKRNVPKNEAEEKAQFFRLDYFEMSSKTSLNIMEVTLKMIIECYEKKYGEKFGALGKKYASICIHMNPGKGKETKHCCSKNKQ